MGVFDFIKGAGEKLLDLNPAKKLADVLVEQARKYKLGNDDLKVEAEGGKVKVSGTASSQAEKEKIVLAMGNVHGIEQVQDDIIIIDPSDKGPAPQPPARNKLPPSAASTSAASTPTQFYTVVKGDTLSKISKQFYGEAQKYQRIFEANRPLLSHPDKIYPGQVLRIPPKA
jgi:nucleoid-associated protein YgaU